MPKPSEFIAQAGDQHYIIAVAIRNRLKCRLHPQRFAKVSSPSGFHGVFLTLLKPCIPPRHATFVAIISISAAYFAISIATILTARAFGIPIFPDSIRIHNHLREKVLFYSQAEIDHHQAWPTKASKLIHEPVYISIDKDVLRKQDAITDWTNGDMTLLQLQAVLRIIYAHEKVIGVDITGECSATLDYLSQATDASINNHANEELMHLILTHTP